MSCLLTKLRSVVRKDAHLVPRDSRRAVKDQRDDIAAFEATLRVKDEELQRKGKEVDGLRQTIEALKRTADQEKLGAREAKEAKESAAYEVERLQARLNQGEIEAKNNAVKFAGLQRAYAHLEKEQRDTLALLETRTGELKEAQAFLSKADNIADSEVQRVIEHLNSKIFQTAATMADDPQFRYGSQVDGDVAHRASASLEQAAWLGSHLLAALSSVDHSKDSVLVQTAIQACMTTYTRWLATSWDLGLSDPKYLLYNLYSLVREREPQSVAGRWRAISRTSLKALSTDGEAERQTHTKAIANLLAEVMLACGVPGSFEPVRDALQKSYASALEEIAGLALDFQRVTGELVVSRDLVAVVITPEGDFNSANMDDEWADPKHPSHCDPEKVLCTTQLGLMREETKEGVIHSTLLVKPKVVLRSMLQRLWDEISQETV